MSDVADAAVAYLIVSARLVRLRLEREVGDSEESEWASVLEVFWDDLDEAGRKVVEEGIQARRVLLLEGAAKQESFRARRT